MQPRFQRQDIWGNHAVACGDPALNFASMQYAQWEFVAIHYCHMQGIYVEASTRHACQDLLHAVTGCAMTRGMA